MYNLLETLATPPDDMPSQQKKLCRYISTNCQSAYLMTIGELSSKAGVGRATVMRLLERLQYKSYSDFKKELNNACIEQFVDQNMDQPFVWPPEIQEEDDNLTRCFIESTQLMRKTLETLDRAQFNRILDLLLNGRQINLLGLRTSFAVSQYFGYQLEMLLSNVRQLGDNESLSYDRALRFGQGDVLFVIGLVPVTASTVHIVKLCHQMGVPVVVITDSPTSPLLPFATASLCTPRNENKRLSILPTMAVLEAICNEIGLRTAPMSVRTLNRRDQYLSEQQIWVY